ncbi:MAG: cache domain-containing protein [Mangrovibacterium sp.]
MSPKRFANKSIFDYFRFRLIGFSILSIVVIVLVFGFYQVRRYQDSADKVREEKIATAQYFVQNMVAIESSYITKVKGSFDERKVLDIETNVQEVYDLASMIYRENRHKMTHAQIKRLIIKSIASLASSSTRQCVSINSTEGIGVYNKNSPQFDGKDLTKIKDRSGSYFVQDELEIVHKRGEGFRYVTDTLTNQLKVVYVKEFPELDWYFVSLVYPSDYYDELVDEIASKMSVNFFDYKADVFIIKDDGRAITTRGKIYGSDEYLNIAILSDPAAREAFRLMQDSLKENPGGSFVHYPWYARGIGDIGDASLLSPKISYIKKEPSLGWLVGAGFFIDEVTDEIEAQVSVLREGMVKNILQIIFLFVLLVILEMILLRWFERQFKNDFNSFVSFFRESGAKLNFIDLERLYSKEFCELGAVANEMIAARQLVEKRLLSEQERAKEADRLKSAFLANMSHEIRTPMNAIIGFSNFLVEDLSKEEREEFVDLIRSSGDHLLNLIDSIIDFSKIEIGKISLKENYVSYSKLCFNLKEKYHRLIEKENLNVEFHIENALPVYLVSIADEHRLNQVLCQILDNAFKFTSSGKVSLHIEQKLDRVYFKISDTGIGISPENQQRIFERFTQVDGNLSRNYGGTGIGLAIASKLIEMMAGEIWVESEVGKGSKFQFFIPLIVTQ